jgi:WD40 repeat protein
MDVECIYTAASVNRTPHCLAWSPDDDVIIFGSSDAIVVAELVDGSVKIISTLAGHSSRVNCVRWISKDAFVSASTDATIRTWIRLKGSTTFTQSTCLKGHGSSVTCVDGLELDDSFVLASTSADSTIKVWKVPKSESASEILETIPIHRNGFAFDLRILEGPNSTLFLIVSTDACKVIVFTSDNNNIIFSPAHQVNTISNSSF